MSWSIRSDPGSCAVPDRRTVRAASHAGARTQPAGPRTDRARLPIARRIPACRGRSDLILDPALFPTAEQFERHRTQVPGLSRLVHELTEHGFPLPGEYPHVVVEPI